MNYLTVSHAFYSNSDQGFGFLYGLAYRDGNRSNHGLAPSIEEARAKAQALAASANVPVKLHDALSMTRKRQKNLQRAKELERCAARISGDSPT